MLTCTPLGSSAVQRPRGQGTWGAPASQLTADFSASGNDGQIFGTGGAIRTRPERGPRKGALEKHMIGLRSALTKSPRVPSVPSPRSGDHSSLQGYIAPGRSIESIGAPHTPSSVPVNQAARHLCLGVDGRSRVQLSRSRALMDQPQDPFPRWRSFAADNSRQRRSDSDKRYDARISRESTPRHPISRTLPGSIMFFGAALSSTLRGTQSRARSSHEAVSCWCFAETQHMITHPPAHVAELTTICRRFLRGACIRWRTNLDLATMAHRSSEPCPLVKLTRTKRMGLGVLQPHDRTDKEDQCQENRS
jgi:hypothetical protein